MARDRRIGFRGRHLIRQVFRNRNGNVRRMAFNELMHHLSRRHRQKLPAAPLGLGPPGEHRRVTRKAAHLLRSLRKARAWTVVRRLLAELRHEIERMPARRWLRRTARAAGRAALAIGRGAGRAGRHGSVTGSGARGGAVQRRGHRVPRARRRPVSALLPVPGCGHRVLPGRGPKRPGREGDEDG